MHSTERDSLSNIRAPSSVNLVHQLKQRNVAELNFARKTFSKTPRPAERRRPPGKRLQRQGLAGGPDRPHQGEEPPPLLPPDLRQLPLQVRHDAGFEGLRCPAGLPRGLRPGQLELQQFFGILLEEQDTSAPET